jgi:hypothetical protein
LLELSVLVLGTTVATVTRYVALRTWIFARPPAVGRLSNLADDCS